MGPRAMWRWVELDAARLRRHWHSGWASAIHSADRFSTACPTAPRRPDSTFVGLAFAVDSGKMARFAYTPSGVIPRERSRPAAPSQGIVLSPSAGAARHGGTGRGRLAQNTADR